MVGMIQVWNTHPDDGTPGCRIGEDEEAREHNHDISGRLIPLHCTTIGAWEELEMASACKYQETNGHADASDDEGIPTTKVFHNV